jgi:hypothetical protein
MADDGFLLLGAAETVVGLTDSLRPVPGHRGLYAKPAMAAKLSSRVRPLGQMPQKVRRRQSWRPNSAPVCDAPS